MEALNIETPFQTTPTSTSTTENEPNKQVESQDHPSSTVTCNICLETLHNGDSVAILESCRHVFHRRCVGQWFAHNGMAGNCPVCRQENIWLQVLTKDQCSRQSTAGLAHLCPQPTSFRVGTRVMIKATQAYTAARWTDHELQPERHVPFEGPFLETRTGDLLREEWIARASPALSTEMDVWGYQDPQQGLARRQAMEQQRAARLERQRQALRKEEEANAELRYMAAELLEALRLQGLARPEDEECSVELGMQQG